MEVNKKEKTEKMEKMRIIRAFPGLLRLLKQLCEFLRSFNMQITLGVCIYYSTLGIFNEFLRFVEDSAAQGRSKIVLFILSKDRAMMIVHECVEKSQLEL